jgi:hypothetical protein
MLFEAQPPDQLSEEMRRRVAQILSETDQGAESKPAIKPKGRLLGRARFWRWLWK